MPVSAGVAPEAPKAVSRAEFTVTELTSVGKMRLNVGLVPTLPVSAPDNAMVTSGGVFGPDKSPVTPSAVPVT
jgi:hypothetical protein